MEDAVSGVMCGFRQKLCNIFSVHAACFRSLPPSRLGKWTENPTYLATETKLLRNSLHSSQFLRCSASSQTPRNFTTPLLLSLPDRKEVQLNKLGIDIGHNSSGDKFLEIPWPCASDNSMPNTLRRTIEL